MAKPLKEALEAVMRQYGAVDWAVAVRGPLDKILAGDRKAAKIAYWEAGSGEKGEEKMDELRLEFLKLDLEKLQKTMVDELARISTSA